MTRPVRFHAPGVLCHVISRGNNKQAIFTDEEDNRRYLEILERALARFQVQCSVYCLLVTHVHLLLRPSEFPIWRMMQQLNSTYCQWWNRRHDRVGHVLQGRYKLLFVDNDIYHRRVVRYIVRNPVAAQLVADPSEWHWSSYRASAGLVEPPPFLDIADVWSMFPAMDAATAQAQFRQFAASSVDDHLVAGPLVAGPAAFAAMLDEHLRRHRDTPDFVYAERFATRPSLGDVMAAHGENVRAGAAAAFHDHAYTLSEIGAQVQRPSATVWKWVRTVSKSATRIEEVRTA